jgi:uncharacterized protein (DUF1330 family)
MKANYKLALALLAGIAVGGAVIEGVHAQMKPPTYAVIAIQKITDANGYKEVLTKGPASAAAVGATFVIRTDQITSLDGPSPARFVLLKFDTPEQAQAWHNSAAQKEVDAIRIKTSDSLAFMVPGAEK